MSDRDKKARERLNKKYIKQKVTTDSNEMLDCQNQLKKIQGDFEEGMIPISFIIVDYENIYFVKPTITISEMLTSDSLQKRIDKECKDIGVNTTLLDVPSIVPMINYSNTIQQWIDINSNSSYIVFRYKTNSCTRHNQQEQKKENDIQTEPPCEKSNSALDLQKMNEQLKIKLDSQNCKIDDLSQLIKQINNKMNEQNIKIDSQNDKINEQNIKIDSQNAEIQSLKLDIHALCVAIKPLNNLHKRILIEKYRFYLIRKYANVFESQVGVRVTPETTYRDVYQYTSSFLNELHSGISSSLITCTQEKECLQHALGHLGSFYQIISDTFIHDASKQSIAESILRSNTTNQQIWLNMFKFVFNEEPALTDN